MLALAWTIFLIQLQLSQSTPCPQVIVLSSNSKKGNISSPNYPSAYPPDADCTYLLQGSESQGIEITFHDLDLEPPYSAGCLSDYIDLDIYDLRDRMTLHKRFCGSYLPATLTVLHPKAKLVFRSNHAVHHRGFLATYKFVEEGFVKAPNNTQPCGEERLMQGGGGGILQFPGNNFDSPFSGLDCTWLWRVDYNRRIYLRILELEFQGSIENCHKAQLAIYDGYEHSFDESTVLKKFCGDKSHYKGEDDRALLSSRNRIIIRFITSPDVGERGSSASQNIGFRIVWSEVTSDSAESCAAKNRFSCKETRACISKDHLGTFSSCPQMNYCIPSDLICDGIPHCAETDASDERRCLGHSLNAVIIGAPVSFVAILSLALCTVIIKRRDLLKAVSRSSVACWKKDKRAINAFVLEGNVGILYPPLDPLDGGNRGGNDNSSLDSASLCPMSDSESSDVSMCPYHGHKYMNHLPVLHEVYNLDSDDSSFLPPPPEASLSLKNPCHRQFRSSPQQMSTQAHNWRLKTRPMKRTDAVCISDDCKSSSAESSPCMCHNPMHAGTVSSPASMMTPEKIEDSGIELVDSFDLHTNGHHICARDKLIAVMTNSVDPPASSSTVHRSIQTDCDDSSDGSCGDRADQDSADCSNNSTIPHYSAHSEKFYPLCSTVTTFGVYPESTSTDV